jgi:MADS-box transcription factor
MKKAYELSVLCGVTVSLLIFSPSGKPYEFSSGEFDAEVDRYNEYEGTIERRRAAEFEAMAKAGEDDDEDEDEDDRPGKAKPNGPSKSLKGKETFKARRSTNRDGDRERERGRDRGRDRGPAADESFVGGLLEDSGPNVPPSPRRHSSVSEFKHKHHVNIQSAGLQYALGLQQQQQAAPAPSQTSSATPWNAYRPNNATPFGFPYGAQAPGGPPFHPNSGVGVGGPSLGGVQSMPSGNGQWDSSMLTTYAWLQIQQAHQEQKRHLLEKQQQQLLELTSRSGGAALFRDILGGPSSNNNPNAAAANPHAAASAAHISAALNEFVWPTASGEEQQISTPPDDDLVWALSGAGGPPGGNNMLGGPSIQTQAQFGIDYPMTMDGKRRDPRDVFAAAAAAKRRKQ